MNDNVYTAPNADLVDHAGLNREEAENALSIAKRQKHLLYCFLVYLVMVILFSAVPVSLEPIMQLLAIPLFIAIVIFTARLALKVYPLVIAVLMIILSVVPLVNILIILAVSARATNSIKRVGFKVGFFGANINAMEDSLSAK